MESIEIKEGQKIAKIITSLGCNCYCVGGRTAPQLTKYDFNLKNIMHLQKVARLIPNLTALLHGTKVYMTESSEAHFSLFVQNKIRTFIELKRLGLSMKQAPKMSALIGVDTNGEIQTVELENMPHMIIGGQTGGGKSVLLNTVILSLCCYNKPTDLGLVLIDPKRVEFNKFKGLPHLIMPILNEIDSIELALIRLVAEMESRYNTLSDLGLAKNSGHFKHICVIIDELSDLVLSENDRIKPLLIRLLQKARACGITVICATQSVRAKVLDGNMLANAPTRVALACANVRESILILGHKGAENLQGKGDAILKTAEGKEYRLQVPYITDSDILTLMGGKK